MFREAARPSRGDDARPAAARRACGGQVGDAVHGHLGDEIGVGRGCSSSIWVGNTLTPRTIIMSSERPVTFSMRRMLRAVPAGGA